MTLNDGFLLKVNKNQFRSLFPSRENILMSEGKTGKLVIVETYPIPKDVILCDYGCNKNLVDENYFYLFMIDTKLCQGTVCKECYEKSWKDVIILNYRDFLKEVN